MKNLKQYFKIIGFEVAAWISALVFLAFIYNPGETHFNICPIANLGFDFCPGCGLGNSISYIFNGEYIQSFQSHPLGIFALAVLLFRIIYLIKYNRRKYGKHITTNAFS
ncbi:MAG: DUF2752 domain-containing protein [Ignavibacteria bacterium]|nr:DUF2752 domain-containing protein [Ignavibacteria bacterium]